MGTGAQVDKVPLLEEAELLVLGEVVYKLDLVGLALFLHQSYSLLPRKRESFKP